MDMETVRIERFQFSPLRFLYFGRILKKFELSTLFSRKDSRYQMITKKWLILIASVCGALSVGAAACGPAAVTSSETPSSASSAAATVPPATAAPTEPLRDRNPLTGLDELEPGASTRPVAVMIGNDSRSRPQYGLDKADLLIETETEGGITRMMAVFANASRVSNQLGPVRSARSPFALLAQSLDAVYVHAGGSEAGLKTIQNIGLTHINGLVYDGTTFWRDSQLRKTKGLEYSMMTSGEKLTARIKSAKIRSTSDRSAPFSFGEKQGTGKGNSLQVVYSGAQSISFVYDAATGLYTKSNGKLGSASVHKTAGGDPITVSNVLVMYDQKYSENATTISFRLNKGTGLLVSGGTSRAMQWSRTNSKLSFQETDGSPLQVTPGKSYICLVSSSNAGATVVG